MKKVILGSNSMTGQKLLTKHKPKTQSSETKTEDGSKPLTY